MSLLKWAIICMIVAGVAALFGFGGIAAGAADIAKILFYVFLVICAVLFVMGLITYKSVT